ncbi:MAG: YgjV family protein [Clostridia bacterium]|nr:YgjV family protein [Clostridia bacterium]
MEFILAQVFGGIALVIVCVGYFLKTKGTFMITQVVGNLFYACAFFVVGSYVGAGLVGISIFRCLYIYFAEKFNFKFKLHLLPIFIVMYIAMTVLFWEGALDLLALSSSILFTIGYIIKDMQVMRYVLIIPNALLVIYNVLATTYVSAVLDFIEIMVIVAAIVKFYYERRKNKEA